MLVVIETHPIEYHAPVYRQLHQVHGIPVTAVYGSDFSVVGYWDQEFEAAFAWDADLLSGYNSLFLSKVAEGGATSADAATSHGLAKALRQLKPSAVLTVGYSPRFHRDAWLAGWRAGCPLLFRGETSDVANSRGWLKRFGRDTTLRAAYRSCSRLLYVGRHSLAHFERLGVSRDRLVFSPYCVDASVFETDERARARLRPAVREELGAADSDRVIMFTGKLSHRKGVDLLVAAAKALPQEKRKRLVLMFLGDGVLRSELEAAVASEPLVRARFIGFQNQRQLSRYYHAADLLVLPSRHSETWGLVVNEALHHGVPCVVSDRVGCAPDLIEPGRTGQVFGTDSKTELLGALIETQSWCAAPIVREACRAKVAGYTTERAAQGIAEAYLSAVGDRAA